MEDTRKIKKYADRKLYDMTEKKYITLEQLSELIKAGEEVAIEDNETGEDITASVVSQILSKEKSDDESGVPTGLLVQLLRKGRGTIASYMKKTTELWQSGLTMAEDEMDKLVNKLVKDKELSESEGKSLKGEMLKYGEQFKHWMGDKIDKRIHEMLSMMNLATKDQVTQLSTKIDELSKALERLEKLYSEKGEQYPSDKNNAGH